jgi:hypothetical protein
MKKLLLVVAVFALSVIGVQAQSKAQGPTFGIGPNLALPLGDFGKGFSFGLGATAQVEIPLSDNLKGVGSVGYTSFFGKTITASYVDPISGQTVTSNFKNPSVGLIPILVGARFYPSEQFFIGAQIGLGILTGGGSSTSAFDYYPQIGYDAGQLQFILGYNGLSKNGETNSHVGLTALYKFGGN